MLVSVPGGIRCVILWAIPSLSSRVYHTLRVYPVSPFLPSRLTLTLPAIKSEMILRAAGEEVKLKAKPSWAQLYPSTASCLDQPHSLPCINKQLGLTSSCPSTFSGSFIYFDRLRSGFLRPGMKRTCGVLLGAVTSVMAQVLRARFRLPDLAYASLSSPRAELEVDAGP